MDKEEGCIELGGEEEALKADELTESQVEHVIKEVKTEMTDVSAEALTLAPQQYIIVSHGEYLVICKNDTNI